MTADRRRLLLSFAVDRARFRADTPGRVSAHARSLDGLSPDVPVALNAPDGWSARELDRSLRRNEEGVQELDLTLEVTPTGDGSRGDLVLTLGDLGDATAISVPCAVARVQRARPDASGVVVDGVLDEWDADEFTLAESELGAARAAVRHGSAGLALAFVVADEAFRQPHTDATIWEGDSIQIALSATPATALGYGGHDLEFGAALTPRGSRVWSWYAGESGATGLVSTAQIAVQRTETGLVYEMLLPRSVLPRLTLEPGTTLGFSWIANDDDGQGYRGAVQWTGGMVGAKDASLFGELVLE